MAFFKFRKGGEDHSASAAPIESVEVLRKRAKHRLIGTAILVLVAIIGFPLLVDKPPRPVEFNIPIVIADKNSDSNQIKPVQLPTPAPALVSPPAMPVASAASAVAQPVLLPAAPALATAVAAPAPVAAKTVVPATPASITPVASAAVAAPASETRFVVQVGAFAEQTRAREVRLKLERAGLKTYAQVIGSKEERRIRIRTGPYTTRAQADRDAEKIKKLGLPADILTL